MVKAYLYFWPSVIVYSQKAIPAIAQLADLVGAENDRAVKRVRNRLA